MKFFVVYMSIYLCFVGHLTNVFIVTSHLVPERYLFPEFENYTYLMINSDDNPTGLKCNQYCRDTNFTLCKNPPFFSLKNDGAWLELSESQNETFVKPIPRLAPFEVSQNHPCFCYKVDSQMAYKNVWKDSIRLLKTLKVLSLNLYNKMQKVVISFKQGEPHLVRNNKTWQVSLNFLKNVTDILEKEIQNIRREKTFDGKKFFLVLQNFHIHGTEMYVFVIKNMIQKNLQYYKDSIKCFKEVVINLENKLKKRKQIKQLDEDAQVQMDIGFEWRKFLHVHYAASLELLFNQQKMNITKRSIFQHQCSIM